jgi:hypothetical protein
MMTYADQTNAQNNAAVAAAQFGLAQSQAAQASQPLSSRIGDTMESAITMARISLGTLEEVRNRLVGDRSLHVAPGTQTAAGNAPKNEIQPTFEDAFSTSAATLQSLLSQITFVAQDLSARL